MSTIDVRESKCFSYSQGRDPVTFRFRVTDGHYLIYSTEIVNHSHFWVNCKVSIVPDIPSRGNVKYGVEVSFETFNNTYKKMNQNMNYNLIGDVAEVLEFKSSGKKIDPIGNCAFYVPKTRAVNVGLKFSFEHIFRVIPESIYADLINYLSAKDVTLIASYGNVGANSNLLKMRSSVFRTMFDLKNSREYQTNVVVMSDFSKEVLESFVKFLSTEEIEDPAENACELLTLADKYHIPSLTCASQEYLLQNVTKSNYVDLRNVFEIVCPKLLKELSDKASEWEQN